MSELQTVEPPAKSLAQKAMAGVLWTTGQSVASRAIGIAANFVLAWFLTRNDFGLFGTAATIAAFCEIFSAGGISTILIVRQKSFGLWSTPAAWLSAFFGVLVATLMLVAAWGVSVLVEFERSSELLVLVAIMALGNVVMALAVVPNARLRIDMRFRELALVDTAQLGFGSIGKIAMAVFGFGALSFVIPNLVTGLIRTAAVWWLAGVNVRTGLYLRKWKYLLKDATLLMLTALMFKIITYGDYAVLAFYVPQSDMGLYFFAFTYSVMGVVLLTTGLASVLTPAFSNMADSDQQFAGFVTSTRILMTVVCPICVLQAAISEPGVKLFLSDEWEPAIPLLQILSLGMAGRTVSWIAASLLEAQGRFQTRLILGAVSAIVFLAFAIVGVQTGGVHGMAIAVAVFYPLMSVFNTYVAIVRYRNPWNVLATICLKPVVATGSAVYLAWLCSKYVTDNSASEFVATTFLSFVFYLVMLRTWMADQWNEIHRRVGHYIPESIRPVFWSQCVSAPMNKNGD